MIVGNVCHVEVLKLNHEAIIWQTIEGDKRTPQPILGQRHFFKQVTE